MPRAKFIRDEKQLLDALRENPTRRAVAVRSHSKRYGTCLAVTEFRDDAPSGSGRVIAWIKPGARRTCFLNARAWPTRQRTPSHGRAYRFVMAPIPRLSFCPITRERRPRQALTTTYLFDSGLT